MISLPPEILDLILSLLPPIELQSNTLNLIKALGPNADISKSLLSKHLRLTREGQSWELAKKLKLNGFYSSTKTVIVQVWRDDSQLLINLLQSFNKLIFLNLTVGPLFSPEVIEELLTSAKFKSTIKTLEMRFNPYVMERSYYTFLKGTYFDIIPLTIASWSKDMAPNLKHLSFIQDFPPNHGAKTKVTPAFGLSSLTTLEDDLQDIIEEVIEPITSSIGEKKDFAFAQPIVFFKLTCITTLATSKIGSQLTHLRLRLPKRNLLPALTDYSPTSIPHSFPNVLHLDLSTTHILSGSNQFPLLLRLHPNLKFLILDRVTGLIGKGEQKEFTALLTMKWLGKCCGGLGSNRSEDVLRAWRREVKDRPTFVAAEGPPPEELFGGGGGGGDNEEDEITIKKERKSNNRSGFANMPKQKKVLAKSLAKVNDLFKSRLPMLVKDILIIPSAPKLNSLGFGLLNELQIGTEKLWRKGFEEGYEEGLNKTIEKGEQNLERWELWRSNGSLEDGTRRLVTFKDAALEVGWKEIEETDQVFSNFCKERGIVSISPAIANEIINKVRLKSNSFILCCLPDCTSEAGKPHLSLLTVSKESVEVREKREKKLWQEEADERKIWRKESKDHLPGCAHLESRKIWDEEEM